MLLREHVIEVELFDAKFTYAQLKQVLEHKLQKTIVDAAPKLIWCINDIATRCAIFRIGEEQFALYSEVARQSIRQDWDWIDQRFGPDDLHHLAKSDVKMGLKHLYEEMQLDNDSTMHATTPAEV
jgi:GAF domain-containing protein